jgi:hypothetical protein
MVLLGSSASAIRVCYKKKRLLRVSTGHVVVYYIVLRCMFKGVETDERGSLELRKKGKKHPKFSLRSRDTS